MILDNDPIIGLFYADLSDEAAAQLVDLLYQIFATFEEHYFSQIRRHHRQEQTVDHDTRQLDFFPPSAECHSDPF